MYSISIFSLHFTDFFGGGVRPQAPCRDCRQDITIDSGGRPEATALERGAQQQMRAVSCFSRGTKLNASGLLADAGRFFVTCTACLSVSWSLASSRQCCNESGVWS